MDEDRAGAEYTVGLDQWGLSAQASFVHLLKKMPTALSFASFTTRTHDYFCQKAKSRGTKAPPKLCQEKTLTFVSVFSWRVQWGLNPRHPA